MATDDDGSSLAGFKPAAHELAMAILTHDFGKREREVLTAILIASYDHYRRSTEAFYPGYEAIAQVACMSKGNAHSILSGLRKSLVVDIQANGYGFRLPIQNWKVRPIIDPKSLAELLPLTFRRDDLQEALRETFVEQHKQNLPTHRDLPVAVRPTRSAPGPDVVLGETGVVVSRESAGSGNGGEQPLVTKEAGQDYSAPPSNTSEEARAVQLVPESGTTPTGSRLGNQSPTGSRIGNQSPKAEQKPLPTRVFPVVPDSGTGAKLASLVLGTLGTKQDCKVASTKGAPIGDDLQPCNLGLSALSGEKQDLFDQMETLGFWSNDRTSKNNWLKFVRSQPIELIEDLLGEVRYRLNNPRLPALETPGAFANYKLRQWRVEW